MEAEGKRTLYWYNLYDKYLFAIDNRLELDHCTMYSVSL